jgi:serine/threonine protein kinase
MTHAETGGSSSGEGEPLLRAFDLAWRCGGSPALEAYLPPGGPKRPRVLAELVRIDMEYRHKAGVPANVLEYLDRFPELKEATLLAPLLRDEWALRRRAQPDVTLEDFRSRFPALGDAAAKEWEVPLDREACLTLPHRLGKFELLGVVGRGTFGVVYRALDTELGRHVAVKMPRPHAFLDVEDVERFLDEARCAAALKHPHIVTLLQYELCGSSCYLVSEFIEGQTLTAALAERPMAPREAATLLATLADAVDYAHRRGILHRDISPRNILLDATGAPHLTDFGLAKRSDSESGRTHAGEPLGTPLYMSPEQARGELARIDPRSDLYGLGAVLYQALTGRPPFSGSREQVVRAVLEQDPTSPRKLVPSLPRDLDTICLKCLEKVPERRYPDAASLAEDLRRFLEFRPIVARPVGPFGRSLRWCARRPAIAASIALAALCAGSFAVVAWQRSRLHAEVAGKSLVLDRHVKRLEDDLARYEVAIDSAGSLSPTMRQPLLDGILSLRADLLALPEPARGSAQLVRVYHVLGSAADRLGRSSEAMNDFAEAIALAGRVPSNVADAPSLAHEVTACRIAWANLLRRQGHWTQAEAQFRHALATCEPLASRPNAAPEARAQLAEALNDFGKMFLAQGRQEEARAAYLRARDLRESLVREQPEAPARLRDLAASTNNLGLLELAARRHRAARTAFADAVPVYKSLSEALPVSLGVAQEHARCLHNLALANRYLDDSTAAREAARTAIAILEPVVQVHPDLVAVRADLAFFHDNLAMVLAKSGRRQDALEALQTALELAEEAHRTDPAAYERLLNGIRFNQDRLHRAGPAGAAAR